MNKKTAYSAVTLIFGHKTNNGGEASDTKMY